MVTAGICLERLTDDLFCSLFQVSRFLAYAKKKKKYFINVFKQNKHIWRERHACHGPHMVLRQSMIEYDSNGQIELAFIDLLVKGIQIYLN